MFGFGFDMGMGLIGAEMAMIGAEAAMMCGPGCMCARCVTIVCPPGCLCIRCAGAMTTVICPVGCTCTRCIQTTTYGYGGNRTIVRMAPCPRGCVCNRCRNGVGPGFCPPNCNQVCCMGPDYPQRSYQTQQRLNYRSQQQYQDYRGQDYQRQNYQQNYPPPQGYKQQDYQRQQQGYQDQQGYRQQYGHQAQQEYRQQQRYPNEEGYYQQREQQYNDGPRRQQPLSNYPRQQQNDAYYEERPRQGPYESEQRMYSSQQQGPYPPKKQGYPSEQTQYTLQSQPHYPPQQLQHQPPQSHYPPQQPPQSHYSPQQSQHQQPPQPHYPPQQSQHHQPPQQEYPPHHQSQHLPQSHQPSAQQSQYSPHQQTQHPPQSLNQPLPQPVNQRPSQSSQSQYQHPPQSSQSQNQYPSQSQHLPQSQYGQPQPKKQMNRSVQSQNANPYSVEQQGSRRVEQIEGPAIRKQVQHEGGQQGIYPTSQLERADLKKKQQEGYQQYTQATEESCNSGTTVSSRVVGKSSTPDGKGSTPEGKSGMHHESGQTEIIQSKSPASGSHPEKAGMAGMTSSHGQIFLQGPYYMLIDGRWEAFKNEVLTPGHVFKIPIQSLCKIKITNSQPQKDYFTFKLSDTNNRDFIVAVQVQQHCQWFARTLYVKLQSMGCTSYFEETQFPTQGEILKKSEVLGNWEKRFVEIGATGLKSYKIGAPEPSLTINMTDQLWTRFEMTNKNVIFKLKHHGIKMEFAVDYVHAPMWARGFYRLLRIR